MKKIYSFIIMALMLCVGFASCSHEEDDLFGESAAQRLNKSVDKYQKLLTSSENGWVMEFLPSDGSYGGFIYTAKFGDEDVSMASDLSLYSDTEEWPAGTVLSSKYSVKAEQGVILTFDTYNLLFHFFSEPQGSSDVDGYESDYEFTFLKTSEDQDTIYLRGKKYENILKMYKLKDTDAETFIKKTVEMSENLSKVNYQFLKIGNKEYPVDIEGKTIYINDIDSTDLELNVPMFYTPEGFHFYEPISVGGKSFQYFKYDEATGNIVADDNQSSIDLPSATDQFLNPKLNWNFDGEDMCDGLKELYDKLPEMSSSYTFEGAYIGKSTASFDFGMGYDMIIGINWNLELFGTQFSSSANYGIDLSYDEAAGVIGIKGLGEGSGFTSSSKNKVAAPFVDYILDNAPYKATFNDGKIKTQVKLESTKDPSVWFTLKL